MRAHEALSTLIDPLQALDPLLLSLSSIQKVEALLSLFNPIWTHDGLKGVCRTLLEPSSMPAD